MMSRRIAIPASALALAASCLAGFERPEVTVETLRMGSLGLRGGVLYVDLRVSNPNRFALEAAGLSYDLDVRDPDGAERWIDVAEGVFVEEVRVPARDSARVSVPVEFTYDAIGSALRSILATGALDYRVSGEVSLEEPVRREVPYRQLGRVAVLGG